MSKVFMVMSKIFGSEKILAVFAPLREMVVKKS